MSSRTSVNPSPIPVLVYHQIDVAPAKGRPFRSLYVSPGAFARQMKLLKALGYIGLSMTGLMPYLQGERQGRVVGITFDDGYLNNLTHALPVLARYGFSSTCYAVSGLAGQTNRWDEHLGVAQTQLMDAVQMRLWMEGGQEIGSHTRTHVNLPGLDDAGCRAEISAGATELEAMVHKPIRHFCYPYGQFESRHVDFVIEQGFLSATTTQRGRCHRETDLLKIPRVPILRSTTLPLFLLKLSTAYEDKAGK